MKRSDADGIDAGSVHDAAERVVVSSFDPAVSHTVGCGI